MLLSGEQGPEMVPVWLKVNPYDEQIMTEDKPRQAPHSVISLQLSGRSDLQRIL